MAGAIFIILTLLAALIAAILNRRSNFIADFLQTLFFVAIPAIGIYCALEHKEMGMRILLGIVSSAIAGYLFWYLGMGFTRLLENLPFSVGYTLEKIVCIIFLIGGIGLGIWASTLLPSNWISVVSYIIFVPLFLIVFWGTQYQYKN